MIGRILIFGVINLSVILLSFHNSLPEDFTLAWSTYLGGGTSWDQARDVCVDKLGNVIVVGGTASPNFPTTPGCLAAN